MRELVAQRHTAKHRIKYQHVETMGQVATILAAIAVAPLILFALLWTSLMLWIGGAALLHWVGLG